MHKLFLDTNVVIDLLGEREPFFEDIAEIATIADNQNLKMAASSLTFVNTHYVLEKSYGLPGITDLLTRFRILCEVTDVNETIIDKSLHSGFNDFEDAVQYFSAIQHKCDVFITRNKKDFKNSEIPIMTPSEFLASINKR
ncbi:twitching motility protein PilT [Flavobacterium akiainvivens]|uniref:Twitching motility protein PilT n=1 Tax=Flavobacterium akiainvivens TaxID=1202724 RepID=A0A0M8MDT9_9FLAO|nr:PIN domain-containing protein [Flavobacterium akiainvivens]KOS06774.1 twitching motility protein PilT [Flavobacterium akiainvivens]SFQ77108.1 Predicted nucleic acid-binding protein, contains PIN domain [Flavobacterium akiainvivens]